jgi:hypothetical protein
MITRSSLEDEGGMAGSVRLLFLGLVFLVFPVHLSAQAPAERDWSATLRQDAQALHDDIAANHPGAVNPQDPKFAKHNDAQLALALKRAKDARTYGDYFFALREYVGSFNDGHMGFGAYGDTPNNSSWPGFLTNYDVRGDVRVASRADDAPVPLGAKLIGCDGHPADQVAAMTLGKMWGRWQLESQRRLMGTYLFADEGSRYIRRPSVCTFEVDGKRKPVALNWRPIPLGDLLARTRTMSRVAPREFESRILGNGTRWFSFPSFNGEPESSAGKTLPPIIASMRDARPALSTAPAIVFDLRGNGGGSSDWSRQIAEVIWGRGAVERLPSDNSYVEWRVSRTNLDSLRSAYARQGEGGGLSTEMRIWFETVIAGLTAAVARGDALWREPEEKPAKPQPQAQATRTAPPPLAGVVYVLTDEVCASACLDAVDLWRALGAVPIGRTTSADTLYMDIRPLRLPSGIAGVSMPRKVYRNRPRGANVPIVPVYSFDGDIADNSAVEQWVSTLPARPSR